MGQGMGCGCGCGDAREHGPDPEDPIPLVSPRPVAPVARQGPSSLATGVTPRIVAQSQLHRDHREKEDLGFAERRRRTREALAAAMAHRGEGGLSCSQGLSDEVLFEMAGISEAMAMVQDLDGGICATEGSAELLRRASAAARLERAVGSRSYEELVGAIRQAEEADLGRRGYRRLLAKARTTLEMVSTRRALAQERRRSDSNIQVPAMKKLALPGATDSKPIAAAQPSPLPSQAELTKPALGCGEKHDHVVKAEAPPIIERKPLPLPSPTKDTSFVEKFEEAQEEGKRVGFGAKEAAVAAAQAAAAKKKIAEAEEGDLSPSRPAHILLGRSKSMPLKERGFSLNYAVPS